MAPPRPLRWLAAGLMLVLALLILGLRVGSYTTSYGFILNIFRHYNPADPAQLALVELRLPRLLLALAGASLAVSGYLLQTLVTNPLADSYLMGTASGASLGAIAACVLVPSLTLAGVYLPPVAALAGAFGATVLTGGVVALCGPAGFVGQLVPHLTRGLLGTTGRYNLLGCAVLGGAFRLACDLLARLLYPPAGLPVGLVTALFGVPFFVYLLRKTT